jgi:hypothetical protein
MEGATMTGARAALGRLVALTAAAMALLLGPVLPVLAAPAAAAEETVIDQSFTSGTLEALINECCPFVAQTFTAGVSGVLAGVNVDVFDCCASTASLRVAITTVDADHQPTDVALGQTTVDTCCPDLARLIPFPQTIPVQAGVEYAIVLSYPDGPPAGAGGAQGAWLGFVGDGYPRGRGLLFLPGDGWIESGFGPMDLHFRTYVEQLPTPAQREECKAGGWRELANEQGQPFDSQGACVRFVVSRSK